MSADLLRLVPKVFVTQRAHNGTTLLIIRLMSAFDPSTAVGRLIQDRLRQLNRRFGGYVSPAVAAGASA